VLPLPQDWLRPLASALGVVVALQIPYFLLRRSFPRLLDRLRYQLWALSLGLLAFEVFAREALLSPRIFGIAAFVAAVLTLDIGWRGFERFFLARQRDERGRPAIPQLVRDVAGWILLVAVVLVAGREFFGWDVSKLALQSAVVSAVLGFALQDVLKNVFAGMALQTELPFDTGDWLEVDGEPRQVIGMTWRSTHLRNTLGVDFREPNANLVSARVKNLGSGVEPIAIPMRVQVAYGSPPRLVKDSLEKAVRATPGVVEAPAASAFLVGFADSGVEYEVRAWTREVHAITRLRDHVLSRIWYQLHRDGWKIPYPVRTVEVEPAAKIAADKAAWRARRAEELLARIDLFAALSEETRRRVAAGARLQYFDAGERLVSEGETGDSLFILARGAVIISKSGRDIGTTSVALAVLREGEFFGEMSLLTGAPRSASVTSEGPCEVFVLDRQALAPILEADPQIAEVLSKRLAERLAATAARFEDREEEIKRSREADQNTILRRIRSFFGLG
jgi:small-conductance mechanosensitive channel/CRP-like cAMP-binding protein